jgi:hypothetical protein
MGIKYYHRRATLGELDTLAASPDRDVAMKYIHTKLAQNLYNLTPDARFFLMDESLEDWFPILLAPLLGHDNLPMWYSLPEKIPTARLYLDTPYYLPPTSVQQLCTILWQIDAAEVELKYEVTFGNDSDKYVSEWFRELYEELLRFLHVAAKSNEAVLHWASG